MKLSLMLMTCFSFLTWDSGKAMDVPPSSSFKHVKNISSSGASNALERRLLEAQKTAVFWIEQYIGTPGASRHGKTLGRIFSYAQHSAILVETSRNAGNCEPNVLAKPPAFTRGGETQAAGGKFYAWVLFCNEDYKTMDENKLAQIFLHEAVHGGKIVEKFQTGIYTPGYISDEGDTSAMEILITINHTKGCLYWKSAYTNPDSNLSQVGKILRLSGLKRIPPLCPGYGSYSADPRGEERSRYEEEERPRYEEEERPRYEEEEY